MATYKITRDGVELSQHNKEVEAWQWLLDHQSASVSHATQHEGYDIIYPDGTSLNKSLEGGN